MRADEERTQAGDHPIREAEIGGTLSGSIQDQQLVLDEHGFGDHPTRAARLSESGDRRQQMHNKDDQIRAPDDPGSVARPENNTRI
jgi:hypothetical protein